MEILKKHRTGVRLFLPVFVLCFAIAAIALLFAAKPVASASAEEENYTVVFTEITKVSDTDIDMTLSLDNNGILTISMPAGMNVNVFTLMCYKNGTYMSDLDLEYDRDTLPATLNLQDLLLSSLSFEYGVKYKVEFFVGSTTNPDSFWSSDSLEFFVRKQYSLPETPTKEGHTFTGWYLDEDCTQPYDGRPITEDMQLYAGWEINKYTVSFNSNGGEAVEALTVDWNSTPSELPTPTREGHTFLGWFDGDSAYDNAPITADKTLTAHWQINTYTVTFMSDGEVYKEIVVEWGTSFQTVMNANGMAYFNLLTTEGAKMSKGTPVKSDMTVAVEEMSGQEKAAEFFAQNWWVLIVAGVALVIVTAIIVSAVKGKRR